MELRLILPTGCLFCHPHGSGNCKYQCQADQAEKLKVYPYISRAEVRHHEVQDTHDDEEDNPHPLKLHPGGIGHFDGVFYRIDGADVSASVSTDVWSDELYQHDACQFEGVWYPDGDLAAETYIRIDDTGRWSYYRRAPGAEPVETDYGTFSYPVDETSIYYADSALHDGVSYRVFELDDDALVWDDEGTYYWME